jgi:hypothetical protein
MASVEDQAFWQGIRLGIRRAVIAGIGLAGLFAAAAAPDRAGYHCGLGVFAAVCLVLFLEIKRYFDGVAPLTLGDLLIDDFPTLAVGLPLLGLFCIGCLFVAAHGQGRNDYYAGLGGAVTAVLVGLASIKACFDRAEAG